MNFWVVISNASNPTCSHVTQSRWVDSIIKVKVSKFTNKDSYQFGDMTKEILLQVAAGRYTLDDLFMLLKVRLAQALSVEF